MNSSLINWFYTNQFTNESKLTVNLSKEYLSQIPIAIASKENQHEIIQLVDQILTSKKTDPNADTSALEKEIDQLVYKLYDLTPEEIGVVEKSGAQS